LPINEVIIALKKFLENPTKETYIACVNAMRKDLWGRA
jgi:hypothetical protein